MNLEQIRPAEIAPLDRLEKLEKQYRRSRQKLKFLLLIPGLWLLAFIPTYILDIKWLWEDFAGWCILVLFGIGGYAVLKFPIADDVIHAYAQEILPGLLRKFGVENPRVSKRHDLSFRTMLESGLYHDKFNGVLREDSVQGTLGQIPFGMYEIAIQVNSTIGARSARTSFSTNHFYGWFIQLAIPHIRGVHTIVMRRRIHGGESDDWHEETLEFWQENSQLQKIFTSNPSFDEAFLVASDLPETLRPMLDRNAQEFLLYLAQTTRNSFAISVQHSKVYMMIGHENPTFRKSPDGNFTTEINREMMEDAKWFVDLIRGLGKTFKVL